MVFVYVVQGANFVRDIESWESTLFAIYDSMHMRDAIDCARRHVVLDASSTFHQFDEIHIGKVPLNVDNLMSDTPGMLGKDPDPPTTTRRPPIYIQGENDWVKVNDEI
jgi:hypothetical protein